MTKMQHKNDWTVAEAKAIYNLSFPDLVTQAICAHREHFDANVIETASLLSIKTGGCPENCGYCSQSTHHNTGVRATKLMNVENILEAAQKAKKAGAQRFCMGAAWRNPKDRDMDKLCKIVSAVSALELETCMTLGMLTPDQVTRLKNAGLDFYNHNIDTSPEYYSKIASTRTMEDRLETLEHVRRGGIHVCSGGILGMGEDVDDRISMLVTLAILSHHPESVPINLWNEVQGVPVQSIAEEVDPIALVRTIALARIMMPGSVVRLSAGRSHMSDELQSLCFLVGANSIFLGEVLLTTENPAEWQDAQLIERLGMQFGKIPRALPEPR